ncbi:MAG: hypothetical protein NDJ90_10465, partial [Oligoflexia bacterium]|nr:hypothetical protein [Oligoflexia bacterium]
VSGPGGNFEQELSLKPGERKSIEVRFTDRAIATGARPQPVPAQPAIQQVPNPDGRRSVVLRLEITPGGGRPVVLIHGRQVDPDHPFIEVPLDSPLELSAERNGFKSIKREFVLESDKYAQQKEVRMELEMEPIEFGFLTLRSTPSADVTIMLEGRPWVRKTPLQREKLPAGSYNIKLSHELLGMEKTVPVIIQDGRVVELDVRLDIKN